MTRKQTEKAPAPTETVEQQWLFQWARAESGKHPELVLMYHIPNEGKRSRTGGKRAVAEGLKSGVPDICLPVARGGYHGLYIEMKRQQGSYATQKQREWIEALREQGYRAEVCRGFDEASELILAYLRSGDG